LGVLLVTLIALGAGSGRAGSSELQVDVGFQRFTIWTTRDSVARVYGGTGRAHEFSKGLSFTLGLEIGSAPPIGGSTRAPDAVTVRYVLPTGLRWGDVPPEPKTTARRVWPPWGWSFTPHAQNCTVAGQVAECRVEGGLEQGGLFGWLLDVMASRGGSYLIRVEIVDPPASADLEPRDNYGELTVIFSEGASAAGVKVGAVTLSRPRLSVVKASVRVTTATGLPVMPKGVTCKASFGTAIPGARPGLAQCAAIFNNARHRGKTLRGTLKFTANGRLVTRRFSVRV
jgi:hypothetical protein